MSACCIFFSSCKKENRCDCFKRTGSIIKENRNLTGFTKIAVEDNITIFITQDSLFEVVVEAGKNIAPLIKTEVVDGTLMCKNDNRCNWTRSYKNPLNVYVRMPLLTHILSNGTGLVKSLNTIETPDLYVRTENSGNIELSLNTTHLTTAVHGSTDLNLSGNTQAYNCYIGGTGFLNAKDFHTNYMYLHANTLGLCYIYVSGTLDCLLDQKGDVFCYGNPSQVNQTTNSSGKLYIQ